MHTDMAYHTPAQVVPLCRFPRRTELTTTCKRPPYYTLCDASVGRVELERTRASPLPHGPPPSSLPHINRMPTAWSFLVTLCQEARKHCVGNHADLIYNIYLYRNLPKQAPYRIRGRVMTEVIKKRGTTA